MALLIGFMAGSLPRLWPWNRDTLFSVKLDGNITSMRLPGDSAALEAARSAGADITALEFEYGMPENFTWSEFWQPAILIIIGVLLVIGMEFVSGHKNSTDKSTAGDAN